MADAKSNPTNILTTAKPIPATTPPANNASFNVSSPWSFTGTQLTDHFPPDLLSTFCRATRIHRRRRWRNGSHAAEWRSCGFGC
jgi:hypothetical protein